MNETFLKAENRELRLMLCLAFCHQPYLDDGEMQDNRTFPYIDYKNDSVESIKAKILERNLIAMAAQKEEGKQ